jgi:hypothetical protein
MQVTVLEAAAAPAQGATKASWAWLNSNYKQPQHYKGDRDGMHVVADWVAEHKVRKRSACWMLDQSTRELFKFTVKLIRQAQAAIGIQLPRHQCICMWLMLLLLLLLLHAAAAAAAEFNIRSMQLWQRQHSSLATFCGCLMLHDERPDPQDPAYPITPVPAEQLLQLGAAACTASS